MGLKASRDALIAAAAGLDGVAAELNNARTKVMRGDGRGSEFGSLAESIQEPHDTFITSMLDALAQGDKVMREIADALQATAKDYGATDTAVADTFHNPDGTPA
ncbi:type VII secretion target [Nocardioides sp. LHG3406-4]|uniref:type VII secretion target n=1 Tax=Nocardioides sp. LHG3406-4 TaxID=2804575 RepID=UPI003CFBC32F